MSSKSIEVPRVGACVYITGLVKAAHYNGKIGVVKSAILSGRVNVLLKDVFEETKDGKEAKTLSLKPENLTVRLFMFLM